METVLSHSLVVAPRGEFGERPPHLLGFRLPVVGLPENLKAAGRRTYGSSSPNAHLLPAERRQVTSPWRRPLSGSRTAVVLLPLFLCSHFGSYFRQFRPIPVRRNFQPWDCKVTPVPCACQEGNTICCISSNDGLDAGCLRDGSRVFHIGDGSSGGDADILSLALGPSLPHREPGGQPETSLRLLIGCAKVEIPVDGLWEAMKLPDCLLPISLDCQR